MVKKCLFILALLALFSGSAWAQPRMYLSLAVEYGAFFPASSTVSDHFGSAWSQASIGWFEPVKPSKWSPTFDITWYSHRAAGSALLFPVTFGVERGLGGSATIQPYLAFRAGPYYGNAHASQFGIDGHTIGADVNASLGAIYKQRYFVELRYDYFTEFAHTNFSGISLFGGIRVIDIGL